MVSASMVARYACHVFDFLSTYLVSSSWSNTNVQCAVIMQMDADQLFLNDRVDVSLVRHGKALAARYGLGKQWVKDWGLPFCGDRCSNVDTGSIDASYGAPYILNARDTLRHAAVWADLIEEMRDEKRAEDGVTTTLWMIDMYAAVIAAMRLGIDVGEKDMMVSRADIYGNDEPWHMLGWESPIAASSGEYPGLLVAHYCQEYFMEDFSWYKGDSKNVDLRQCDRRATIPDFVERLDSSVAKRRRTMTLAVNDGDGFTKQVEMARTQWMFENAVRHIRDSIAEYYRSHC